MIISAAVVTSKVSYHSVRNHNKYFSINAILTTTTTTTTATRYFSNYNQNSRRSGNKNNKSNTNMKYINLSGSSHKWMSRHLKDPYVLKTQEEQRRSRASFKLEEIQKKYKIFQKGKTVIDLGSAPGGWTEIAVKLVSSDTKKKKKKSSSILSSSVLLSSKASRDLVCSIDIIDMESIPGAQFFQGDFYDDDIKDKIINFTGKTDIIISDMAPNTCGDKKIDHIRCINLCYEALEFSQRNLKVGGHFICKYFRGGKEKEMILHTKKYFKNVYTFKPKSSRNESTENFLIATNFLAFEDEDDDDDENKNEH